MSWSHCSKSYTQFRGLAILPAAGFGVRMGQPPAKELLPHPLQPHHNLIEHAMEMSLKNKLLPLIIVRKSKLALIDWLRSSRLEHQLLLIDSSKEWVDTLIQSASYWWDKNILILPDTHFQPESFLSWALSRLDENELVLGVHKVPASNASSWGIYSAASKEFCEKPQFKLDYDPLAWGLVGFQNTPSTLDFWMQYEQSALTQKYFKFQGSLTHFVLDTFVDLTRGH